MDLIRIKGLRVFAHHGVYAEEKERGQHFILNAELFPDLQQASETDELTDTVNYGEVCRFLAKWTAAHPKNLLEAAAGELCRETLRQFPRIRYIRLELEKPEAPIPLELQSVSVRLERGWNEVFLGLGGNLGDPEKQIREALSRLEEDPCIRITEVSSFITTSPYGGVEQPDFLNGACRLETLYSPQELLSLLKEEEKKGGRTPSVRWGPRALDLDILFYATPFISSEGALSFRQLILKTETLTIPHADLPNRLFVLKPLCELAPGLMHPVLGKSMEELLTDYSG